MATILGQAQTPDPNFHIYLAFGQSNMEGQNWKDGSRDVQFGDLLPDQYQENVDPRFQVMAAVTGDYKLAGSINERRTQGQWYTAVPPLARPNLGLSPADYFGRTLVAGIPNQNVKVGVIVVAVMGAAIEGFEKVSGENSYFNSQPDWMKNTASQYGNNPYNRLVTMAREAKKVGVIKGIIMHQGESGSVSNSTEVWKTKVKGIYDNLLSDLELPENSIPILAGQAYGNNNGNINAFTSAIPGDLPGTTNKIAHIIPSNGCGTGGDNVHFNYEGYKTLGERYGEKMLELLYSEPVSGFAVSSTVSPAAGGTVKITPAPDANGRYEEGSTVTVTAEAADGWKFAGWSGDAESETAESFEMKMNDNKTVTAKFLPTTDGPEMIKNGNFANEENWTFSNWQNSAGSFEASGGSANITVTTLPSGADADTHSIQLVQGEISLEQGMTYRLTFDAYAAAERTISMYIQKHVSDYNIYHREDVGLTTGKQTFSYEFEMTSPSDNNARVAFNFGNATPDIFISNVSLNYLGDSGGSVEIPVIRADADADLRVNVLPNSTVNVNFTATGSGETELRIYSLNGTLVASDKLYTSAGKNYSHTFDRQKLPGGFYVVWLNDNGNVEQAKVVVPK